MSGLSAGALWVLDKFAGKAFDWSIGHLPGARRFRARMATGGGLFDIPEAPVHIVVPMEGQSHEPRPVDAICYQSILDLCENAGLKKGTTLFLHKVGMGSPLPRDAREGNLICIGGPVRNPVTGDILTRDPNLVRQVLFHDSHTAPGRAFIWHNTHFRWDSTTDYGLMAVRPSPYCEGRKVALIFGLRETGTQGVGDVWTESAFKRLRHRINREIATGTGEGEVLFRVCHDITRTTISDVFLATPEDGVRIDGSSWRERLAEPTDQLRTLYSLLRTNPSQVHIQEQSYHIQVTPTLDEIWSDECRYWSEDLDVAIRGKEQSDPYSPISRVSDLRATAEVVEGQCDVVMIPAENSRTRVRFLLFMIPPIPRGGPAPLVRVSLTWPKGSAHLGTVGGHTEYVITVPPNLAAPVEDLRVRLRFDLGGVRISLREEFRLPGRQPRAVQFDTPETYEFQAQGVPAGFELVFVAERLPDRT